MSTGSSVKSWRGTKTPNLPPVVPFLLHLLSKCKWGKVPVLSCFLVSGEPMRYFHCVSKNSYRPKLEISKYDFQGGFQKYLSFGQNLLSKSWFAIQHQCIPLNFHPTFPIILQRLWAHSLTKLANDKVAAWSFAIDV